MEVNWDVLINGGIMITLAVVFIAKLTKQTVPELIRGITDYINGTGEDAIERGEDLVYYE